MAKNWTASEAAKIMVEGKNTEAILDITRRCPLAALAFAQLNAAGLKIVEALPAWYSARKINSALMGDVVEADEAVDEEEVLTPKAKKKVAEPEPAAAPKKKKAPVVEEDDEDEEEEVPAPKAKKKKAPVIEDDDDEDDEVPAKKTKKKKPVDDDFDFDE